MQKRIQYVKTSTGLEKQLIASAADIVEIDAIEGLTATNVQEALEQLNGIAATGGVTSVNGKTGAVTLDKSDIQLGNVTNDAQVKRSEMGVANGVATLGSDGKVPTSQLPSYVDDVVEHSALSAFPSTGETGKIYVALDTNKTYRWGGSSYVEISTSLALGETSSTAYAGDKGKQNADDIAELQDSQGQLEQYFNQIMNGNLSVAQSNKAKQLTDARKISLSGDATGETTFDGTADKDISVTLANSGVAAGTYSTVAVDIKGRVTAGSQIVEWGTSGQSDPSTNLAVGGLFFALVE